MTVLDASGILHSDLDHSGGRYLAPNSVLSEIASENAKTVVDQGIRNGRIKVVDPQPGSVEKATEAARETGDLANLSQADLEVLALALEKKAEILSDDYAIQNVARKLGIKYSVAAQEGIKKEYVWEKVCPGCGRSHPLESRVCRVCGSGLKRRGK